MLIFCQPCSYFECASLILNKLGSSLTEIYQTSQTFLLQFQPMRYHYEYSRFQSVLPTWADLPQYFPLVLFCPSGQSGSHLLLESVELPVVVADIEVDAFGTAPSPFGSSPSSYLWLQDVILFSKGTAANLTNDRVDCMDDRNIR